MSLATVLLPAPLSPTRATFHRPDFKSGNVKHVLLPPIAKLDAKKINLRWIEIGTDTGAIFSTLGSRQTRLDLTDTGKGSFVPLCIVRRTIERFKELNDEAVKSHLGYQRLERPRSTFHTAIANHCAHGKNNG